MIFMNIYINSKQGWSKLFKSDSKLIIMLLQKIYFLNKLCSFKLSMDQRILKHCIIVCPKY